MPFSWAPTAPQPCPNAAARWLAWRLQAPRWPPRKPASPWQLPCVPPNSEPKTPGCGWSRRQPDRLLPFPAAGSPPSPRRAPSSSAPALPVARAPCPRRRGWHVAVLSRPASRPPALPATSPACCARCPGPREPPSRLTRGATWPPAPLAACPRPAAAAACCTWGARHSTEAQTARRRCGWPGQKSRAVHRARSRCRKARLAGYTGGGGFRMAAGCSPPRSADRAGSFSRAPHGSLHTRVIACSGHGEALTATCWPKRRARRRWRSTARPRRATRLAAATRRTRPGQPPCRATTSRHRPGGQLGSTPCRYRLLATIGATLRPATSQPARHRSPGKPGPPQPQPARLPPPASTPA